MTMFFLGFLSGGILFGGGVVALMWRDWRAVRKKAEEMEQRLTELELDREQRAREADGK